MLVLGRRLNESVRLGDDIVITVLAVEGDRVKIGIEAPSDVTILRQELYETVRQANLQAASGPAQADGKLLVSLHNLLRKKDCET